MSTLPTHRHLIAARDEMRRCVVGVAGIPAIAARLAGLSPNRSSKRLGAVF